MAAALVTRLAAVALLMNVALTGCHRGPSAAPSLPVTPVQSRPSSAAPVRMTPVQVSLNRLLLSTGFSAVDWKPLAGWLVAIEHDVPRRYEGVVVETVYRGAQGSPCWPASHLGLFGWAVRSDSLGIDAIMAAMPGKGADRPTVLGRRRWCDQRYPHPLLGVYSIAGGQEFGSRGEFAGEVFISGHRSPSQPPRSCETISGYPSVAESRGTCEVIEYVVSIRAIPARSVDSVGPGRMTYFASGRVSGFRVTLYCDADTRPVGCPGPKDPARFDLPAPGIGTPHFDPVFIDGWAGRRVFRTALLLRFHDAVSDARRREFLERHDMVPMNRYPAGSLVVQIPDAGPDGLPVVISRLQSAPEVREVFPIDSATRAPAHEPIRMRATVVDSAGRPVPGVHLCAASPSLTMVGFQNCSTSDGRGAVSLVPLAPMDVPVYAVCRRPREIEPIVLDSSWIVVRPGPEELRFTVPTIQCDPIRYQERPGRYSGLLSISAEGSWLRLERLPMVWIDTPAPFSAWSGWPRKLRPSDGCYQVELDAVIAGPAGFGPDRRWPYAVRVPPRVLAATRVPAASCRRSGFIG